MFAPLPPSAIAGYQTAVSSASETLLTMQERQQRLKARGTNPQFADRIASELNTVAGALVEGGDLVEELLTRQRVLLWTVRNLATVDLQLEWCERMRRIDDQAGNDLAAYHSYVEELKRNRPDLFHAVGLPA